MKKNTDVQQRERVFPHPARGGSVTDIERLNELGITRLLLFRSAPLDHVQSVIDKITQSNDSVTIDLVCQKGVMHHFEGNRHVERLYEYPDGPGLDKTFLEKDVADDIISARYEAVVIPLNVEESRNYEKVHEFADWICETSYDVTPSWKVFKRLALRRLITMPRQYIVAASSRCDVKCIFCASGDRRFEFGSDMPYETFEGILSSLNNRHAFFGLLLGGEPFLNKKLMKMAKDIKSRKRFLSITTHANLIDRKLADDIVDLGVDELRISVHAGQKELYEKVMRGANWESLLKALEALKSAKASAGSLSPEIYFIMTGMKLNFHQLPDVVALAGEYGVSKVIINTFMPNLRVRGQSLMEDVELLRRYYVKARKVGDKCGVVVSLDEADNYRNAIENDKSTSLRDTKKCEESRQTRHKTERSTRTRICTDPWINVHLYETGVVLPCCGGIETPFGNLNDSKLAAIWNNDNFISLRSEILSGELRDECRNCQLKAMGQASDLWRKLVHLGIESRNEEDETC